MDYNSEYWVIKYPFTKHFSETFEFTVVHRNEVYAARRRSISEERKYGACVMYRSELKRPVDIGGRDSRRSFWLLHCRSLLRLWCHGFPLRLGVEQAQMPVDG